MNTLKTFVIGFTLLFFSLNTPGFSFNLGPFHFGGGGTMQERHPYSQARMINRNAINRSLCYAITQQKQVEVIVRQVDKISDTEKKITLKKLIINPYVLGMDKNHHPILRANVADEKIIKEVTVKYSAEAKASPQEQDVAYDFSNQTADRKPLVLPAKGETGEINIFQFKSIRVMEDSHFDAPKDFDKLFKDTLAQVFCHINRPVEK